MGITKIHPYTDKTLKMAKIASALGHPARLTIMQYLFENKKATYASFQKVTRLTPPTISSHIKILANAGLVYSDYYQQGNYFLDQNAEYLVQELLQTVV